MDGMNFPGFRIGGPRLAPWVCGLLLLLLLSARPVRAQLWEAIDPGMLNAVLTNMFGTNAAFSSVAEIELPGEGAAGRLKMAAGCCRLDGKFRIYVDTDKIEGLKMPGQAKRIGLGRIVSIVRPDKGAVFEVFPDAQGYIEKGIPAGPAVAKEAFRNLERTWLGDEVIDRHPCQKYALTVKQGGEEAQIGFLWAAADLRGFPVQIQLGDADDKSPIVIRFRGIKFARLDASLFEVPTSFQRYDGIAELYQARANRTPVAPPRK